MSDEFERLIDAAFNGNENDDLIHTCSDEREMQCVDCAKMVSCWNDNGTYLLCNDCLFVEDDLMQNRIRRMQPGDEFDFDEDIDYTDE